MKCTKMTPQTLQQNELKFNPHNYWLPGNVPDVKDIAIVRADDSVQMDVEIKIVSPYLYVVTGVGIDLYDKYAIIDKRK